MDPSPIPQQRSPPKFLLPSPLNPTPNNPEAQRKLDFLLHDPLARLKQAIGRCFEADATKAREQWLDTMEGDVGAFDFLFHALSNLRV